MDDALKVHRRVCHRPAMPATNWSSEDGSWQEIHANRLGRYGDTLVIEPFSEADQAHLQRSDWRPCLTFEAERRRAPLDYSFQREDGLIEVGESWPSALTSFLDLNSIDHSYNPLEIDSLWREFVQPLRRTFKAVTLFKKYGFLLFNRKTWERSLINQTINDKQGYTQRIYAENLHLWLVEIERLELAKSMWSVISSGDIDEADKVKRLYEQINDIASRYAGQSYTPCVWPGIFDFVTKLSERDGDGMLYSDFWAKFWRDFDIGLIEVTYKDFLQVFSSLVNFGVGELEADFSINESGNLVQTYSPPHLASAVWLQFSNHISRGGGILACKYCSSPFLVRRGQHSDKAYCGSACKQAAWRNSPEQRAKRLARTKN